MSEAGAMLEAPRRLRWLINTVAITVLLWTAYCGYAWATRTGIWRITMDAMRQLQTAPPSDASGAFIAWGLGLGALLALAWPVTRLARRG